MSSDPEPKPVLWVSLTDSGRGETTAADLDAVQDRLEDTLGGEYHIVVADDRVRLATQEDLRDLRRSLDDLLPSDVPTEAEQREQMSETLGLSASDVMGSGTDTDAPGVQEPADGMPEGADDA
jgi:hypothetical protein